jgi:hypothetical protein
MAVLGAFLCGSLLLWAVKEQDNPLTFCLVIIYEWVKLLLLNLSKENRYRSLIQRRKPTVCFDHPALGLIWLLVQKCLWSWS